MLLCQQDPTNVGFRCGMENHDADPYADMICCNNKTRTCTRVARDKQKKDTQDTGRKLKRLRAYHMPPLSRNRRRRASLVDMKFKSTFSRLKCVCQTRESARRIED